MINKVINKKEIEVFKITNLYLRDYVQFQIKAYLIQQWYIGLNLTLGSVMQNSHQKI